MGSNLPIAELMRPVNPPRPPAPSRQQEGTSSEFTTRLKDVRIAARKSKRADHAEQADSPKPEQNEAAPAPKPNDQATQTADAATPSPVQPVAEDAAAVAATVASTVGVNELVLTTGEPVVSEVQTEANAQSSPQSPTVAKSVVPVRAQPSDAAPDAPTTTTANAEVPVHTASDLTDVQAQQIAPQEDEPPVCEAGPGPVRVAAPPLKPIALDEKPDAFARPVNSQDKPVQPQPVAEKTVQSELPAVPTQSTVQAPTKEVQAALPEVNAVADQPRVDLPSAVRKKLTNDKPKSGHTKIAGIESDSNMAPVLRAQSQVSASSKAADSAPVGIRGGDGDSAVTTLAKFLVTDTEVPEDARRERSTTTTAITDSTLAGTKTAPRQTPSSPAGVSRPADIVGQLLVPEAQSGDAIGAAARVLRSSSSGGRQQVTLQLDPPELGQLRLEVRMQDQAMTLRVDVDSQRVARLIESRLPELRDALATHGLRIERSDVVVRAPSTGDANTQTGQQDHSSSSANAWHGGQDAGASHSRDDHLGSWNSHGNSDGLSGAPMDANMDDEFGLLSAWNDANEQTSSSRMWVDLVA